MTLSFYKYSRRETENYKKKLNSANACHFLCGIREIGLRLISKNFNIQVLCASVMLLFTHLYNGGDEFIQPGT